MGNDLIVKEQSLDAVAVNFDAKIKVCDMIAKSGLAPASFKTPQAIFAAILRGGELGFSPMQSLETFDVVQGRVTMRASGLQALCVNHGGKFEVIEESDTRCTIKASRASNGWAQEYTFTIEDASKMQLTSKDNWKKMPKFMLYARCVSVLCRRGWPDKVAGLYSSEEMRDSVEVTQEPEVVSAPVARVIPADTIKESKAKLAKIEHEEKRSDARFVYDGTKIAKDFPDPKYRKELRAKVENEYGAKYEGKVFLSPKPIKGWEPYLMEAASDSDDGSDLIPDELPDWMKGGQAA